MFTESNPEKVPAGRYAPFTIANLLAVQQRERFLATMLAKVGLSSLGGLEILDVGCGGGGQFLRLMSWGASPHALHGIDVQADRVTLARTIHPDLEVLAGTAAALPWSDGSFDMVAQFTTFTSIPDLTTRNRAAQEMDRVLKPGGHVLWYDFWINPFNPATHPIRAREVRRLFPKYNIQLRRVTLAPPIARAVAPKSQAVASMLQEIWPLQTHLCGVLTKPGPLSPAS